jgi:hypothetical protein
MILELLFSTVYIYVDLHILGRDGQKRIKKKLSINLILDIY